MKNLDEVVEKLKDIKRNIVSPKEIYELGITRYFMERLIKEGYLQNRKKIVMRIFMNLKRP